MDGTISSVSATTAYAPASTTPKSDKTKETEKEQTTAEKIGNTPAATYEKSAETDTKKQDKVTRTDADRAAFIEQAKLDIANRQQQLADIVSKMMGKQGEKIGMTDDMWKTLASGKFEVDAATKAQAEADIAEDGYWGVEKTSDRIVDFAKALAGDDPEKADKMIEAFKKGYEEATKTWGKELPDITKRTYDSVLSKMDDWKNGKTAETETETE
jgi:hypothetical protein